MPGIEHPHCGALLVRQFAGRSGWPALEGDLLDQAHGRHRHLAEGQMLIHAGAPLVHFFLPVSGSLKSVALDADGNEQVMAFYLPGELIGLDALGHEVHRLSVVALEPTEVCELHAQRLEAGAERLPGANHGLLQALGRGVGLDQDHMELLARRQALERLSVFLHQLAERRQRLGLPHRRFRLSMSRQDIASYLGLVIETVSRCFGVLQEEGVIAVDGRQLEILQPERLGLPPARCGLPDLSRKRH